MKNSHKTALTGATLLMAAALHTQAQADNKWYLTGDAGVAITPSSSIQKSVFGYNGGDVKFDTGVRGGLALGYAVKPYLDAELQTGVIWNDVNSILGNRPTAGASASMYQVPILANLIYKPWHGAFQPYIGAGVGGVAATFDMSNLSPASNLGLYAPSFNDTDWVLAYQGELGFSYALNDRWTLGLAYKFLGTTDHDWNSNGNELKIDGTVTHAIEATLSWNF